MKRQIPGLHCAAAETDTVPDGLYLVQVHRAQYRWHALKPFYVLRFALLEPKSWAGSAFTARLYCSAKALWKLAWFLRDFGYDSDLLADDAVDEKAVVGLRGVVKISHITLHGTPVLNLDGFAPAERWGDLSSTSPALPDGPSVETS